MGTLEIASYAVLWIVVILEGIMLIALARQIGLLHGRLGPVGARTINVGPKIGDLAHLLDADDVYNRKVSLGIDRGRQTLLLFISTGCSTCASLIPYLKRLSHDEKENLEVKLLAFGTTVEAGRKYVQEHTLDSAIPFVVSDDLAFRYQVSIAPYGIMIDREGVVRAKGIVNNFAQIESLLNAAELGVRSIQEYAERQQAPQTG